ncbi:Cytochrome P450 [Naviculisporaceae sp. PSN 640]
MSGSQLQQWWTTATEQYLAMQSAIGPLRLSKYDLLYLSLRKGWHDLRLLLSDLVEYFNTLSANQTKILLITLPVLVLLTCYFFQSPSNVSRLGLPVVKLGRDYNYPALLAQAAKDHPDTPYIIKSSGYDYIVFPSSCFDEIKRLPITTASMVEWYTHVFFQGWRFLGSDKSNLHKTIGLDLTRAVSGGMQNGVLSERVRMTHVDKAFEKVLGKLSGAKESERFPLYTTTQEIIAITNAASLLGEDMANNRQWITVSQSFPMAVMIAVFICHAVPRMLRPIVATFAFLPAWGIYWYMHILLRPMVKRDIQRIAQQSSSEKERAAEKYPMTAWLLSRYQQEQNSNGDGHQLEPKSVLINQILHDYIVLSFEATASTAATIYFILGELVTRPGLVEELREEMKTMQDGNRGVESLDKLDSVMRESSRVNNFNHLSLFRRLLKPAQFSTGPPVTFPAGSLLCVDAYSIANSPVLWKDPGPEVFDPLRFWKLTRKRSHSMDEEDGNNKLYKFTSLGSDAPGWGGGSQACPGRVFAGNTIKLFLTKLLMEYDIGLAEGEKKPSRSSMPNGAVAPDMGAGIMLRRRV